MRFLIVPDSFKESATSHQVAIAISEGINEAWPEAECIAIPIADGGEGSLSALYNGLGGHIIKVKTEGPLREPMEASYLRVGNQVFIELAEASGLHLLSDHLRDPEITSTYGTGILMKHALDLGIRHIILCIGGSATNDAGVGIAHALGTQFIDKAGQRFLPTGGTLKDIATIRTREDIPDFQLDVLCDVNNPFTGDQGATYIYGPQKGGDSEKLDRIEQGMEHLRKLIEVNQNINLNEVSGAGAAGGVGGGMVAFFDAQLVSGIDYLIKRLALSEKVQFADVLVTGEGKIDHQTVQGKLISGLVRLCRASDKPIIAICGSLELSNEEIRTLGLTAAFSIQQRCCTWDQAKITTVQDLRSTSYQIAAIIKRFGL